jgi:hypothetical protein
MILDAYEASFAQLRSKEPDVNDTSRGMIMCHEIASEVGFLEAAPLFVALLSHMVVDSVTGIYPKHTVLVELRIRRQELVAHKSSQKKSRHKYTRVHRKD